MTNFLPIPTSFNQIPAPGRAAAELSTEELVKMKTATLKSLVGCSQEVERKLSGENKVESSK
jgi:hypothetical protein